MVILPLFPPIGRNRSSGESAIERMDSVCWMRPTRVCVEVSQKVTVSFVEYTINSPCCGRAMHEELLVSGTDHSETVDPADASNCLIVLSDTTKRWSLDQRRPVLNNGATFTGMSTSERPSLLFQTRTDSRMAVAIRSPCGEYFAAITQLPWSSVSTFLRVARSRTVAVPFFEAVRSRVESGEKSTPRVSARVSWCVKTISNVFVSHTNTWPNIVPAAIHRPSFDTARERTPHTPLLAICLPSLTLHTPSPSPPPTISPFAAKATVQMSLPLISMSGEPSCSTVSINATLFPLYAPVIVDDVVISDTMQQSNDESQRTSCASYPSSHCTPFALHR